MRHKTITRNYRLSFDEKCDCLTRRPLIPVGTKSTYHIKEKAFCTNPNYVIRRDSIDNLETLKYYLEDDFYSGSFTEDSLMLKAEEIDSIIMNLKNGWTHLKIKTKWNPPYGGNEEIVILEQRVKYYNKFNRGKKYIGMKLIVNDSLVESTL